MSTYEAGETQHWPGTETIGLRHSDYRVWIERFAGTGKYEVRDQRPVTHLRFSEEETTFDTYEQARSFADRLLQEQWDKEATSDRRRARIPFGP